MVLKETLNTILALLKEDNVTIKDFCFGLRYSYALIEGASGCSLGLLYTNTAEVLGYGFFPEEIPTMKVLENLLSSPHIAQRLAGTTILNALSQYLLFKRGLYKKYKIFFNKDVISIVDVKPGSKVLLVGFIKPIIRGLEGKNVEYYVVERNPVQYNGRIYHDSMIADLAKNVDYIFISGAALSTNTLDQVLSVIPPDTTKILVGPSAQLLPDVLFKKGIDYIASIRILDEKEVMKLVKLGHGTHSIMRYAEKYAIARDQQP